MSRRTVLRLWPCSAAFSIAPRRVRVSRAGRALPNGLFGLSRARQRAIVTLPLSARATVTCDRHSPRLTYVTGCEKQWRTISLSAFLVREDRRYQFWSRNDRDFCSKFIDERMNGPDVKIRETINTAGTRATNIEEHAAVALLPRIYIWDDRRETRRALIAGRSRLIGSQSLRSFSNRTIATCKVVSFFGWRIWW